MKPEEIREARKILGMTQSEFAAALGLGRYGLRQVGRWEAGSAISGTAARAIKALLDQREVALSSDDELEFWRIQRVVDVTGLSKSEIYRRAKDGTFPKQRAYPGGSPEPKVESRRAPVFWVSTEVRKWMKDVLRGEREGLHGYEDLVG